MYLLFFKPPLMVRTASEKPYPHALLFAWRIKKRCAGHETSDNIRFPQRNKVFSPQTISTNYSAKVLNTKEHTKEGRALS